MISLALVQLPGIAMGILGIMKAFINHGMSGQALKDSLRCIAFSKKWMTFQYFPFTDHAYYFFFHFSLWRCLGSSNSFY